MIIHIKGFKEKTVLVIEKDNIIKIMQHPGNSNNVCEWHAVIEALTYFSKNREGETGCKIYMDNMIVYKQLNWQYKKKKLKDLYFFYNTIKNGLSGYILTYDYVSGCDNPARDYI